MEVGLTDDKVEDVMRQIQKDEDVYVTMHGRVLRRSEKLRRCGVTDGCSIQVTRQDAVRRKTQGQEKQSGEETSHETRARVWRAKRTQRSGFFKRWKRLHLIGPSEGNDIEVKQKIQYHLGGNDYRTAWCRFNRSMEPLGGWRGSAKARRRD